MGERMAHRKSRTGCMPCKLRRVKCGEEKPSCLRCVRRHQKCVYPLVVGTPEEQLASDGLMPNDPSCSSSRRCSATLGDITRQEELNLMHRYSTETCETLSNGVPEHLHFWKTTVPDLSRNHAFIVEGILALAALHAASLDSSSHGLYTQYAIQYQTSGLVTFQRALRHIDEDNLQAIFVFSVMLTVLGIAISDAYSEHELSSPWGSLVSVHKLLRGVKAISMDHDSSIRTGTASPLFQEHRPVENLLVMPSDEVAAAMARLRQRAQFVSKYASRDRHTVYSDGIKALEAGFDGLANFRRVGVVLAVPANFGHELALLLEEGDPMAQLIWLHYGVLALSIHDQWWGRGFGIRLISQLSQSLHDLDVEWDTWTEWARRCAGSIKDAPRFDTKTLR
ncbi:hypothetical protein EsH8_X_000647 [Colletotrichum jinshuiense]